MSGKKQELEGWEVRLNELYNIVKDPEHGVSEKVNKMYHAIFGVNGSDGILRKINKLESAVEVMDSAFNTWCDTQKDEEIKNLKNGKEKAAALKRETFRNKIMAGSLSIAGISTITAIIAVIVSVTK